MKYFYLFILLFAISHLSSQNFTRINTGPVVNTIGDSRSVNWVDINNDGWIDLMITNGPAGGQDNFVYINDGLGGFYSLTDTITNDNARSDGATFADSDNDGDLDCYVVNYSQTPGLYYINDGAASFTRKTGQVTITGGFCETASWGDYDRDGLVDLFITISGGAGKNLLFHNDGDNQFSKITSGAMVNDVNTSRSVNWTDIDNDGDLDIFVTNENSEGEKIYKNDENGFFKVMGDITSVFGNTMSSAWADYDNDGDLDVFLARDGKSNALYRNNGNFSFSKLIDTVSNTNAHSFSSAWSDIDNDGDLDLFVTNSFNTSKRQLNFMYQNNGDGSFSKLDNILPAIDSSWSYGCAFGDYDNDGFEDLAVATVRYKNVDQPDLLYHNDGNDNHWCTFHMTGKTTNKSAIGTKIFVKATINGKPMWQMREISSQSAYCGQNDMRVHFGLGDAAVIDSVIIKWLGKSTETFTNLTADRFLTIVQGEPLSAKNDPSIADIEVFPNPGSEVLNVRFKDFIDSGYPSFGIIDIKGRVLISGDLQTHSIDIKILPPGIYTFRLKLNNNYIIKRFVKL